MNMIVLDKDFKSFRMIDFYKSIIWTDRFDEYGDFELCCAMSSELLDVFKDDFYIWNESSEHMMIIEETEIKTDVEEGNTLIVKGRSLESMLERRIIWKSKHYTGNLQDNIYDILNDAFINPSIVERKLPNFKFVKSDDPEITKLTIDSKYNGENLYTVISEECKRNNIGFKITFDDTNNTFIFKLYASTDRSYDQLVNPYVVFSPSFENIINSNFYRSKKDYRNVTLVVGEGEEAAQKTVIVGEESGLNRREIFTDARDISSKVDDGTMSDSEYLAVLENRGKLTLTDNDIASAFEGKTDTRNMFKYQKDFFLGDIVQINNEYGYGGPSRISEIVISEDDEGFSAYPTFVMITKKE